MELPFQALGKINLDANTVADAMWSRDIDVPDEALITWWAPGHKGAAIVKILPLNGTNFSLVPHLHYEIGENGALRFGVKEPPDFKNFSAILILTNTSLNGQWFKLGNPFGKINFDIAPPKPTITPTVLNSWSEFKSWVGVNHFPEKYVTFRGHGSNKFNLSTTLQRANRARLDRFIFQTMPVGAD